MMKKLLVIMMILMLGTTGVFAAVDARKSLNNVESVSHVKPGVSFDWEQRFTEKNQQGLIKVTQPPMLKTSLERENLIRRYEFLNDRDKMFYVYLMSYGKVVTFFVAKGKVSSVNSRLTQEEQIVEDPQCVRDARWQSAEVNCYKVVGSPQLDGSYGTNGDGIFFFTTEGAYVEWNGGYLVSDHPLKITTPVQLTSEVKIE